MQHPISRQALALLLIAFVLALTPLAYETPLTPPWQGGFFDDGNVDDVVGFVISITVLVEGRPVCCLRPLPTLVLPPDWPEFDPVPFAPPPSSDPRAPPTS